MSSAAVDFDFACRAMHQLPKSRHCRQPRALAKRGAVDRFSFLQVFSSTATTGLDAHITQSGIYYCVVIMYLTQKVLRIASKGVLGATTEAGEKGSDLQQCARG